MPPHRAGPRALLPSLARSSNPSFSDACAIELSEGTETLFRVCFPALDEAELPAYAGPVDAADGAPPVNVRSVVTAFEAGSSHGYPAFAGIAVHFWAERDPTEDDAIIARDIAEAVAFLVSDRSQRITGSDLDVNGGQ